MCPVISYSFENAIIQDSKNLAEIGQDFCWVKLWVQIHWIWLGMSPRRLEENFESKGVLNWNYPKGNNHSSNRCIEFYHGKAKNLSYPEAHIITITNAAFQPKVEICATNNIGALLWFGWQYRN